MQSILQPCNSAREAIIKPIAICPEKQTLAGWLRGGGGAQCSQLRVHSPCICMRAPNCSVYTAAAANYSLQIPYDR